MKAKSRQSEKRKTGSKKIEQQLTALERRLIQELQERLGNVQNMSHCDPSELLDIAAEGEIDYMSAVSAEAGSATIAEVHQALRKLREGTYGACDTCGKDIGKRRLKARPFAVLCIACKEREERRAYGRAAGAVLARPDAGVSISLTSDDLQEAEAPLDEIFRDAEDVEISELY
jgi:DnaK suppressor protein